ncbi:hypothetical protein [Leptolyngbya sp. FACHB-711]|uniref:hypothetical protein n=1 Tax=unclassified Leptolyngbya TaxID=2650499 RepID=UPI001687E88D|nr:hypothetical protein [Leptolyngbya sp. FACHB-711]MBD2024968.1 hypothetical protein [Leptolyngbya sp. FACHB-711]
MKATTRICFESVREWDDAFLMLFPHRFDYIWAEHSEPGVKPQWKTESRHPLSDRLIRQGAYLYGVRFGAETQYALVDIDVTSLYHPSQDPLAVSRIVAALEPLGLVSYLACTSSYSGGLHLYFPFQQSQSSWQLAIVLACLLENAGFKLQPGQLEIFPNPRPFTIDESYSLFNAHRLPLQTGSYLLNAEWQPVWSNSQTFVQQWQFVQQRNDLDSSTLKRVLKQARRRQYGISGKAEKFINDLNTEIERGWTGAGQTNRLLGRITMRSYIFYHVLSGGKPLEGQALIDQIVAVARSLPGYEEWCQHQHEIEHRAEEWARCIENSHYFHFGSQISKLKLEPQDPELVSAIEQLPSWNERQSVATRDRIKRAIVDLLEKGSLPARPTARFQALLEYGIGGGSLYRHRDLWHPNYFGLESAQEEGTSHLPVENPPYPPPFSKNHQLDCAENASNWLSSPSLLSNGDGNNRQDKPSSDRSGSQERSVGGNAPAPSNSVGVDYIQQVLFQVQAQQEAYQQARRSAQWQRQRIRSEAQQKQQINQMQQYLASGDPILVAEARAWAEINPGVLNMEQLQLPLIQMPGSQ